MSVVPLGTLADRIESVNALAYRDAGPAMRWAAARCYNSLHENDDISDLYLEAAALELAAALLRRGVAEPSSGSPQWLDRVRDHLDRHYADPVRLSDLAKIAGVHEVYLVRAFRRHVGVTPGAYLRRRRVEAARDALLRSSRGVAEIALASGFSSQAHLTRVFSAALGIAPATYRKRHGRRRS